MKKFALVYFPTENNIAVLPSSNIPEFDGEDWRSNKEQLWVVHWPTGKDKSTGKETYDSCSGEVKALSDDRRSLIDRRERFIEGGDYSTPCGRKPRNTKRSLAMDQQSQSQQKKSRQSSPCTQNTVVRQGGSKQGRTNTVSSVPASLERVREGSTQNHSSRDSEEVEELRQEVKELKDQVRRLEVVTTRMEHLERITLRLEALLEAPSNGNVRAVERTSTAPPNAIYTDKMTKQLVQKCNKVTPQKFVNDLMDGMYGRRYLAEHTTSAPGRSTGGKRPLPKQDIIGIIGLVQHFFPNTLEASVKACLRQKLNNAGRTKPEKTVKPIEETERSERGDGSDIEDISDRDDVSDNSDDED